MPPKQTAASRRHMPAPKPPASRAQPPKPPQPPSRPLTPTQNSILRRHRLSHATISTLLTLTRAPPPDELLAAACRASEILSFPLRSAERALFSHLNSLPSTIWPLAVSHPTLPWEKAFLLAQSQASGTEWIYIPRISTQARGFLHSERPKLVRIIVRVLRCAADLMGTSRDAAGVRMALELARSIAAGVWEGDDGRELLQVPGIGAKKMTALTEAGVKTVRKLAGMEFYHIERLLKRNPPFGQDLLVKLEGFPLTGMRARVERWATPEDAEAAKKLEDGPGQQGGPGTKLAVVRVQVWIDNPEVPKWRDQTPWVCVAAERGEQLAGGQIAGTRRRGGGRDAGSTQQGVSASIPQKERNRERELLFFWRGSTKKLLDQGQTLLFTSHMSPGEVVYVWASCEEVVGTLVETLVTAPAA